MKRIAQLEVELQPKLGVVGRIKPKEPEAYEGSREAKTLENFLYDCEQFFKSAKLVTDAEQIFHASTFLVKDVKLWW